MKNKLKRMSKLSIVYFALSAVIMFTAISFAAYTSLSSVKRVVTVKGTEQLFTSNILVPYATEGEIQTRIVSFADNSEKKIVEIDIANYIQGDITKFDTYGINYDLMIEVIDIVGNQITNPAVYTKYEVNGAKLSTNPYTTSGFLSGSEAHADVYNVAIPAEYMSVYRLKVTAVPTDSKYSSIGRVIATSTETFTPHWTGHYLDTEKTAVDEGDKLGIINYQISGHMEETCILSWNTTVLDLDPWFITDMTELGIISSSVIESGDIKSLPLNLGKEGTPDEYDIKFYRTTSVNDMDETWADISNSSTGYITFTNSDTGN